jgi:DNA-nicking Smr family endonuclease
MTVNEKPRRRRLSLEEHTLWRGVARSVAPLKRRAHVLLADALEMGAMERKAKSAAPKHIQPASVRATPTGKSAAAPMAAAPRPAAAQPLLPLDRRLMQRLARGTVEIDARIDLHGRTQAEAHAALLRFLQRAQADGAKCVLVITGKGANDYASERGVLKRLVPQWLAVPEYRAYVLGAEDAHIAHGGSGALYVHLRRVRSTRGGVGSR